MMKKYLLFAFILFTSFIVSAQNEVGFYLFPQLTQVNNKANRQDDPIYSAQLTTSWGVGVSVLHQFNKRAGHGPIRGGVTASSLKIKKSLKVGLVYSAHDQKWKSQYRLPGGEIATWEGKKRFDYVKLPVMGKLTIPLNNIFNLALFGGPQVSYLVKAEGGIIYWEHFDTYDYFDLPFSNSKYFNRFTFDAVAGIDLETKISRWVHLITGIRADWSVTTVENNDRIINNYPAYGEVNEYNKDRGNSHNSSLAFILGFTYHFHRSEHGRTRY